jgi:putative hemolysin
LSESDHQPPPGEHHRTASRWRRIGSRRRDGRSERGAARDSLASEQERLIVEKVADLRDMSIAEVMTPRVDVVALTIPVHIDDVADAVRRSGHSCFPVVHDDLDDLVGVLFVNDLFRTGRPRTNGELAEATPLEIAARVRAPFIIPESIPVLEALGEMRRQRRAFAIVVDEYGGVAGVITVKDLLEPLVGDLYDEFDPEERDIVRVDDATWLVDGGTNVDDFRDRLAPHLPDGEYVTMGGLLFDRFGHIPEEGERVEVAGWELEVVQMDKRRVAKVVARQTPPVRSDETQHGEPNELSATRGLG